MKKSIITFILCFLVLDLSGQANLPFEDNFESESLNSNWWTSNPSISGVDGVIEIDVGIGLNSTRGVKIGKINDNTGFTTNALDLRLNLQNETDVELIFWIADSYDATNNEDGIYFSNDGGINFTKAIDFLPTEWCNNFYGKHPPIDVDRLANSAGLSLTSQFVIRFQQRGELDFLGSAETSEDGFYLDEVKVYDPNLIYAVPPFEDDFENGLLKDSWAWNFADATSTLGSNLSSITSPMSTIEVQNGVGVNNTYGVALGKRCDGVFTTNALDLHLNLQDETDVELSFWIADSYDATDNDDGIYFSNDGGVSFTKITSFFPSEWCNNLYGQHPPIDVDGLANAAGLSLTSQFVIRFQQRGEHDFLGSAETSEDGFYLDEVKVYDPNLVYAIPPFEDGFENGSFKDSWAWNFADVTSSLASNSAITSPMSIIEVQNGVGLNNTYGVAIGRRCDGVFTTNAFDLHLDLGNQTDVNLSFWIADSYDQTDNDDGIYFSNDGGISFVKAFDFDFSSTQNNIYEEYQIDVSMLASSLLLDLTDQFVIRFQQRGEQDFLGSAETNEDGFYLDNVTVNGMSTAIEIVEDKSDINIYPQPSLGQLNIECSSLDQEITSIEIYDLNGMKILTKEVNNSALIQQMDVSQIPTGMYLLAINLINGETIFDKIVKR